MATYSNARSVRLSNTIKQCGTTSGTFSADRQVWAEITLYQRPISRHLQEPEHLPVTTYYFLRMDHIAAKSVFNSKILIFEMLNLCDLSLDQAGSHDRSTYKKASARINKQRLHLFWNG